MTREQVLVADPEGRSAVPVSVTEHWDRLEWFFETNGTAALARLRLTRPLLAIINLQLPDMSGSELVEKVKKGRPNVPLVVTSSVASRLCERVGRTVGVVAYLPKPVDEEVLHEVLRSCLRHVGEYAARMN